MALFEEKLQKMEKRTLYLRQHIARFFSP